MSVQSGPGWVRASLLASVVLSLAACAGPTRIATLYQTARIPGAPAETTLQRELVKRGFPSATVSCAKTIIVNVGPASSCSVTGAGTHKTVKFTFRTLDGKIDLSSVKVVS
jgi:hypothetical protein